MIGIIGIKSITMAVVWSRGTVIGIIGTQMAIRGVIIGLRSIQKASRDSIIGICSITLAIKGIPIGDRGLAGLTELML